MSTINITNFTGGLNTGEDETIRDNELAIARNVSYDNEGMLGVRPGLLNFGDEIAGIDGIHSIYYTTFTDGTRILLCTAGTDVYRYDEGTTTWNSIQTGLTDGLDFSFITYKDIIYWCNGTDDFTGYDGTTVTGYPALIKPKYLVLQNDRAYAAGVSTDPSTVFYTEADPVSINADGFANDEPINQDEGIITGLKPLGVLVVVGKTKGIYLFNAIPSDVVIEALDFEGDVTSHRSMVSVENNMVFMSTNGVYSLSQRQGTTGSYRAYAWSENIEKDVKGIEDKTSVAAVYFPRTNNVFMSVDSGEVSRPDKMFLLNTLVSIPGQYKFSWTEYTNITANDFTIYEDTDGIERLLVANSFGGQVVEMERAGQYSDNGLEISTIMRTKTFDFDVPQSYKVFRGCNLTGYITTNETVTFRIDIDGVETSKTFTGAAYAVGDDSDPFPLGEEDIGIDPLGGGPVASDGLDFYIFTSRRSFQKYGLRMTVQVETTSLNSSMKMTKLTFPVEAMDDTIFPNDFFVT